MTPWRRQKAPAKDKPKRTSKRKAVEQHVRSYVEAIGRRDVKALGDHWSEDGVEDLVPIGVLRGREEVKEFFRGVFAAMPTPRRGCCAWSPARARRPSSGA